MSNELLIITEGSKIVRNYYRYKFFIKEKFSAEQIRPYVLKYPRKLTAEEKKYINDLLDKSDTKYKWYTISEESKLNKENEQH